MERIIFELKARKLVKKRHIAYLAHVVDTWTLKDNLSRMPIVYDYLDVFPEESNGLSFKREIEFTIEVVLGTILISQIPYHMNSSELKKLKNQLEELIKKGYIRPNISP
ncbi:putative Retrotransposon protein [Cucumis melo var. makuwa]|uniref:Retrotransposon protein n=1 Tax=Cucumis melo var. makuwa TaxID=1194695 RepID=A0A5A7U8A6_CUCMM|nr:putative Retrotransposon protein [Cucumis melo var. makuwa]TYK07823.1 putative Retrotransposon protein [Cucumis melo var. makuwa]